MMPHLRDGLLVFLGAGLGGVCRWGIGVVVHSALGGARFPLATFLANLAACALIGAAAGAGSALSVPAKLALVTGFFGGLSTMSAFGLETVSLLRRGEYLLAGTNVFLTLSVCFGAVWLMLRAVKS